MAYHKPWTNEDLRAWMIANDFYGSEDKAHFGSVIYNGVWCTLSFIQKKDKYYVISSVREYVPGFGIFGGGGGYAHKAKLVKEVTKNEGNILYKAVKATKRTSKNNSIYYDLGKALDMIPSDSTLKQKFVGA